MPSMHLLHLDCGDLLRSFDAQHPPQIVRVDLSPGSGTVLILELESERPLRTEFKSQKVTITHNLAGPITATWS